MVADELRCGGFKPGRLPVWGALNLGGKVGSLMPSVPSDLETFR